jgi:hypothetical protein
MTTKEEFLAERTHKQIPEMSKRIYYTLMADKSVDTHRIAKTLALLIGRLEDEGILDEEEIDQMLIEVVS